MVNKDDPRLRGLNGQFSKQDPRLKTAQQRIADARARQLKQQQISSEAQRLDSEFRQIKTGNVNEIVQAYNNIPNFIKSKMTYSVKELVDTQNKNISSLEKQIKDSIFEEQRQAKKGARPGQEREQARQRGLREGLTKIREGILIPLNEVTSFASSLGNQAYREAKGQDVRRKAKARTIAPGFKAPKGKISATTLKIGGQVITGFVDDRGQFSPSGTPGMAEKFNQVRKAFGTSNANEINQIKQIPSVKKQLDILSAQQRSLESLQTKTQIAKAKARVINKKIKNINNVQALREALISSMGLDLASKVKASELARLNNLFSSESKNQNRKNLEKFLKVSIPETFSTSQQLNSLEQAIKKESIKQQRQSLQTIKPQEKQTRLLFDIIKNKLNVVKTRNDLEKFAEQNLIRAKTGEEHRQLFRQVQKLGAFSVGAIQVALDIAAGLESLVRTNPVETIGALSSITSKDVSIVGSNFGSRIARGDSLALAEVFVLLAPVKVPRVSANAIKLKNSITKKFQTPKVKELNLINKRITQLESLKVKTHSEISELAKLKELRDVDLNLNKLDDLIKKARTEEIKYVKSPKSKKPAIVKKINENNKQFNNIKKKLKPIKLNPSTIAKNLDKLFKQEKVKRGKLKSVFTASEKREIIKFNALQRNLNEVIGFWKSFGKNFIDDGISQVLKIKVITIQKEVKFYQTLKKQTTIKDFSKVKNLEKFVARVNLELLKAEAKKQLMKLFDKVYKKLSLEVELTSKNIKLRKRLLKDKKFRKIQKTLQKITNNLDDFSLAQLRGLIKNLKTIKDSGRSVSKDFKDLFLKAEKEFTTYKGNSLFQSKKGRVRLSPFGKQQTNQAFKQFVKDDFNKNIQKSKTIISKVRTDKQRYVNNPIRTNKQQLLISKKQLKEQYRVNKKAQAKIQKDLTERLQKRISHKLKIKEKLALRIFLQEKVKVIFQAYKQINIDLNIQIGILKNVFKKIQVKSPKTPKLPRPPGRPIKRPPVKPLIRRPVKPIVKRPPIKPPVKPPKKPKRLPKLKLTFETKLPHGTSLKVDGFVAVKGRKVKVVSGLPQKKAFNQTFTKGSKLYRGVDKSTARSFEFRIVGTTKAKDDRTLKNIKKVRVKLSKNKKVLLVVEKTAYAIDSRGEKIGLALAKKRKKLSKRNPVKKVRRKLKKKFNKKKKK